MYSNFNLENIQIVYSTLVLGISSQGVEATWLQQWSQACPDVCVRKVNGMGPFSASNE